MATVALVSCVKTKRKDGDWPAQDLYCSTWFRAARRYAERHADRWYILSAKYGLLHPSDRVEHYEETLTAKSARERRTWAIRVAEQIRSTSAIRSGDQVLWLAGQKYREYLAAMLRDVPQHCPLASLRQGEQVQWLQANG